MKKIIKQTFIILAISLMLILPYFVFAQDDSTTMKDVLKNIGDSAGYMTTGVSETSFAGFLGLIVSAFLSLLGIIFIGEIIYAGYNWMTARGEEEKVEKAKDTLRRSIIGLVIVVSAYAIWVFIYSALLDT